MVLGACYITKQKEERDYIMTFWDEKIEHGF